MKARDLTELALRNLREALLRNSLTTLGVAVGVASLVGMVSLGVGLQELASERLLRSGLFDAVFVTSPRGFAGPGGGPARVAQIKDAKLLDEVARQRLAKIPNVVEVYPQIRFLAQVKFESSNTNTSVLGLPASSKSSGALEGMKGTFFSAAEAQEVLLQADFAKELAASAPPDSLIGKQLTLRYAERASISSGDSTGILGAMAGALGGGISVAPKEQTLLIVGIIESDPSAGIGGLGGARVFIPLSTAEGLHAAQPSDLQALMSNEPSKPTYLALTVRARTPKDVQAIEGAIKKMGYLAFSLLDAAKGLRIVFGVFDLLLGLFGSLALTVASLGIINTLVMAILERRREIGVLKALGATDGDVKRLFFAEAAAMGLVGGIFGLAGGWLIGRALTLGTTLYLKSQELPSIKISSIPWWLALFAIVFAVLVSLAAGLYPASRAAKLNPVEALRYE
jgi:putative ABC transport system permease protein